MYAQIILSDIITCLLQFPLQQHWLFLSPWLSSANLYPLVHSKWKSVKLDVISWLIDIKCNVRLAHSSIFTVCDKGKVTAISVLEYCRLERVPGGWGSQISRHLAHEGDQVVSHKITPSLPPRKYSWSYFFHGVSWPQGHSAACWIISMKNFNHTFGNRTRFSRSLNDLRHCMLHNSW